MERSGVTSWFNYSATIITSRRIIFIGKGLRKEEKNSNLNKIPLLRSLPDITLDQQFPY